MALIVPLTLPATTALENGVVVDVPEITYSQAYARVICVRVHSYRTHVLVAWYADVEARLAEAQPVKLFEYFSETANFRGDIYPAAYTYLKTLSDFAGAVDHPVVDPAEPAPTQPPAEA